MLVRFLKRPHYLCHADGGHEVLAAVLSCEEGKGGGQEVAGKGGQGHRDVNQVLAAGRWVAGRGDRQGRAFISFSPSGKLVSCKVQFTQNNSCTHQYLIPLGVRAGTCPFQYL